MNELVLAMSGQGVVTHISNASGPYQFTSRRMPRACLLLAMNSCSLLSVISHRWLLSALILRT